MAPDSSHHSNDNIRKQTEAAGLPLIDLDDEPLEHILYQEGRGKSTPMNIFLSGTEITRTLESACRSRDWNAVDTSINKIYGLGTRVSRSQFLAIAKVIDTIIPVCPKPLLFRFDPAPVIILLERIWESAAAWGDNVLRNLTGPLLYRLYEYRNRYDEASIILNCLLDLAREARNQRDEASALNNLGFILVMQKRWSRALLLFEQAAALYKKVGIDFNNANSLCNYWQCRMELGQWGDEKETRAVLLDLVERLRNAGKWHERKPLVLLARFEEHLGNHRSAVRLVVRAIRTALTSGTRFPEEDRQYLKRLWVQRMLPVPGSAPKKEEKNCGLL